MNKYVRQWLIGTLFILAFASSILARNPSTLANPFDDAPPTETYVPPTPTPIWPGLYTHYYIPSVMHGWTANHINLPPVAPHSPLPEDGATDGEVPNTYITWEGGDQDTNTVYYDIYLEAYDSTPDILVRENSLYAGYSFQGWGLTTYYWQVIARDGQGLVAIGPVWHYTTEPCSIWLSVSNPEINGLTVSFESMVSSQCSNITGTSWDWGDGTSDDQGLIANHTYTEPGAYTVTAWAFNDQGIAESETISLYVGSTSDFCDYVTDIPRTECDALLALYEATDGLNWEDVYPAWFALTSPCDGNWDAVTCADGHIAGLYLDDFGLDGTIPPEFGNLTYLTRLALNIKSALTLPTEFGKLSRLENLRLSGDSITHLPSDFGNLTGLIKLSLQGEYLTFLPDEIGNLSKLEELYIWSESLITLPPGFGNLTALKTLDVTGSLSTLPEEFGNLSNLTKLTIQNTQLTNLPDSFGNLSSLEICYLEDNMLTTFPDTIGGLKSLRYINASNNPITSLPEGIGDCISLQTLYLLDADLTFLPSTIGNLQQLSAINVISNSLTTLPDELGQCTALGQLVLSNNQLTVLPENFGNLVELRQVRVDQNALTTLPASIGNLDNVYGMYVEANALTSLPVELGDMAMLQGLNVSDNPGLTGPVPELLIPLPSLEYIIFTGTNWCEPTTGPVADWLADIYYDGTGVPCPEASAIQMCLVDG